MSKSIKLISLMLALLFVFFAFASCTSGGDEEGNATTTTVGGNDNPDDPTGTTQGSGTVTDKPVGTTNKYEIGPAVPSDLKFEGKTITIATRGDYEWVKDEITVELLTGGVSDDIYNRQVHVEDALGIFINNELVPGNNYAVVNNLRNDFTANEYRYDIIGNCCYSTIMYTTEGIFYDLLSLKHLDLSRPYWSQGFNEAVEIGSAQYMCTGAATLSTIKYIFATFFNKTLAKNYGDVDFYDVVNNYEWTIDYHLTFCEQFADTNNEALGEDGTYGFINAVGNTAFLDPYWSSFKLDIIHRDAAGWYESVLDVEKIHTSVDKLIKLHSKDNLGTYIFTIAGDDNIQVKMAELFAAGHAATCMSRIVAVETDALKNMSDEYGIIPVPMYDKAQKEYRSMVHDQFTALGVYSRAPEDQLDAIGAFLDVFAAESYRTVVPAYYDLALKNRYFQDEESGKMLDLIYESVYIDPGILYVKNLPVDGSYGPGSAIRTMIQNGQNTVSAKYSKQMQVILKAKLKALQDSLKALQGAS